MAQPTVRYGFHITLRMYSTALRMSVVQFCVYGVIPTMYNMLDAPLKTGYTE